MSELNELELIKAYIDSTKTFVQLSSAGLLAPVVLKSNVIGLFQKGDQYSVFELTFVCLSWIFFLAAIGAAVLYQYVAIKFVEYHSEPSRTYVPRILETLVKVRGPGLAYGAMVVSFYGGAVTVVLYSFAAIFT
jgi:hypothetical protein